MSRYAKLPEALIDDDATSAFSVRLWAKIERYAGRGGKCYASVATLATDLNVSRATVQRGLSELVSAGWIARHERPGNVWETIPLSESTRSTSEAGRGLKNEAGTRSTSEAGGPQICDGGASDLRQGGLTDEASIGMSITREQYLPSHKPVDRSATTAQKPTLVIVENEPADVLVDVEPIGPSVGRIVQALVGAYADAWLAVSGVKAPKGNLDAIGRNVKPLIDQGYDLPVILRAVQLAAENKNRDINRYLGDATASYRRNGPVGDAMRESWFGRAEAMDSAGVTSW